MKPMPNQSQFGPSGTLQSPPASSTSRYELIDAVKDSRPDAWDRLVRHYGPLIQYWCQQCGIPQDDVADVQQDVFRSVSRAIDGFHHDQQGDTFRGWLRTITQNKARDHFRRKQRSINAVGGALHQCMLNQVPCERQEWLHESVPRETMAADEWDDLRAMIACVKLEFETRTWVAFWRTAIDGQRANDIAEELGMTHAAVRKAKSRVLHRLKKKLST